MKMCIWGWCDVWFCEGVWCLWRKILPPVNGSTTRSAWGETKSADSLNWSTVSINTSFHSLRTKQVHILNKKPPGFFILLLFYERKQAVTIWCDSLFCLQEQYIYCIIVADNQTESEANRENNLSLNQVLIMEADLSYFLGKVDFLLDSKESSQLIVNIYFFQRFSFFSNFFSMSVLLTSICLTLVSQYDLGELYFLATGAPSATAKAGFIYKIVDPSRYLTVKECFSQMHSWIVVCLYLSHVLVAVWLPWKIFS